jgi:histidinol phosphatase-like PHP family hydrolase
MHDVNALIANLLDDLGEVQESRQSRMGYRRAAHSFLLMEQPVTALVQPGGELPKIPNVGPKSLRVVQEVLESGSSPTVEAAVRASGKLPAIEKRRALRVNFLSFSQVVAALEDDSLVGPTRADYRGDFQMHSQWSDGTLTLAEMAQACIKRGYQYSAMTDHGPGLPIAQGLSVADLVRQREAIDQVNAELGGQFLMLAGVEANIDVAGSLGLTGEELRALDLVVAAPHSQLRRPDDQTARMVAAVRTPGVHILGHPRGRQRSTRQGIVADWDRVFAAAAESRVAIEIDGDPHRQDVDFELAQRAPHAGCLFALDSDAHAAEELVYSEISLAHARLAGIPPERVVNTWPLDDLLEWLGGG